MPYTVDTKLGELLADQKTIVILEKYFPGISSNPQISWSSEETLMTVANYPSPITFGFPVEGIGPQKLLNLIEELKKI